MGTDDQVNLPSRAGHLRLRAFYRPIIALAAAAVIATMVMSNHRQFSPPGPVATLYGRIGHWAGMAGFEKVQQALYGQGEAASLRYVKKSVASGRVAVVSFRDEAYMGRGEVSILVSNFGKTNHVKPANPPCSASSFQEQIQKCSKSLSIRTAGVPCRNI
jgi:hypothetical protein